MEDSIIILNPYKKNQGVLHNAIHEKPLPPIVYTHTTIVEWHILGESVLHSVKQLKILATNCVCQINKFHKTVIINMKIGLTVTVIKAETELDNLNDIFFQLVKSLMLSQSTVGVKNLGLLVLQARHMCPQMPA